MGRNFDQLVTSSSLDEQLLKEQICMDSIELATPRTETSSSTFDGNKKEKMARLVCPFNCGDEQQSLASLKYHVQVQHSEKILTRKFQEARKVLICNCCAHLNVVLIHLKHKVTKSII